MSDNTRLKIERYAKPADMEYTTRLETEKEKEKFIKRVENVVRSSMEYRDYIAYLKEYVNMNMCAFFSNVENGNGAKVRIEIHHEPLTLFDIVKTIINKYLDEAIPINDLYIADEVMELHYKNKVGLIPLSKSVHQIIHNSNEIIIPLTLVYGNYTAFLDEYAEYLDEAILDKIERKINETKTFKKDMVEKLTPTYVYVDVEGFQLAQKVPIESKERATA